MSFLEPSVSCLNADQVTLRRGQAARWRQKPTGLNPDVPLWRRARGRQEELRARWSWVEVPGKLKQPRSSTGWAAASKIQLVVIEKVQCLGQLDGPNQLSLMLKRVIGNHRQYPGTDCNNSNTWLDQLQHFLKEKSKETEFVTKFKDTEKDQISRKKYFRTRLFITRQDKRPIQLQWNYF